MAVEGLAAASSRALCCSAEGLSGRRPGPASGGRQFVAIVPSAKPGVSERSRGVARAVVADSGARSSGADPQFVPRICTLKEFSEDDPALAVAVARPADQDRSMLELIAATLEAKAQVQDFETLSGRLAMIGFATALSVEYVTGNSVFTGMDIEGLARVLGLCVAASAAAAGFAVAWRAKQHTADLIASGCRKFMDSALDSVIDGLFFFDTEAAPVERK